MTLFLAMLRVQVRLAFGALIGVTLAIGLGFAMPWLLDSMGLATVERPPAQQFLYRSTYTAGLLLITSLVLGGVAGVAWAEQGNRSRGVYLMTLPLERWRLMLLEFGVMLTILLGGAVAVYVGGVVTAAIAPLPDGLRAYPAALAVRFFTMSLLFGCVLFGPTRLASSPDPRRSSRIALSGAALFTLLFVGETMGVRTLSRAMVALVQPGAPFHVLLGSWQLVDL